VLRLLTCKIWDRDLHALSPIVSTIAASCGAFNTVAGYLYFQSDHVIARKLGISSNCTPLVEGKELQSK
jgi:hypothetical protein